MRIGFPAAIFMLTMVLSWTGATAQVGSFTQPFTLEDRLEGISEVPKIELPVVDAQALIEEDLLPRSEPRPFRYATVHEVEISPRRTGIWESLADGRVRWRQRVSAPGATSLSFGFSRYRMPPGGSLTLYSLDGAEFVGPFTYRDHDAHQQLWTPVLLAEDVVVELEIPLEEVPRLDLQLGSVSRGYRSILGPLESGSCNIDVRCPEGDSWRPQIQSVARYTYVQNGAGFVCTGALVNNALLDRTPFLLTANHCVSSMASAASVVVYWNYENSTCRIPNSPASGAPGDGSLAQFQSGSVLRATWVVSDFTLIELDDPLDPTLDLHFAGWDRGTGDPVGVTTVHHPQGQEKRISFDLDATSTTSYLSDLPNPAGRFLRVGNWEQGTTEGGSSGAPLFDSSQRIVGHLTGGFAACGNSSSDWFGRFSVHWAGAGSASTRLQDWLDPLDTGLLQLDGLAANDEIFNDGFETGDASAWVVVP